MRTFNPTYGIQDYFGSPWEVNVWLNHVYAGAGTLAWLAATALLGWMAAQWLLSGGAKPHLRRVRTAMHLWSHRRALLRLRRRQRAFGLAIHPLVALIDSGLRMVTAR